MKSTLQVLLDARDILNENGRGSASLYKGGCYCVLGAVALASGIAKSNQELQSHNEDGSYNGVQHIYDALNEIDAVRVLELAIVKIDAQNLREHSSVDTVYGFNDRNNNFNFNKMYDIAISIAGAEEAQKNEDQ